MYVSTTEINVPEAMTVSVTEDTLAVQLSDGRDISVPLSWYPAAGACDAGGARQLGAHRQRAGYPLARPGRGHQRGDAAGGPQVRGEPTVLQADGWKPNRQVGASHCTSSPTTKRSGNDGLMTSRHICPRAGGRCAWGK